MQTSKSVADRKQISMHLRRLSAEDLQEVLDFAEFIHARRRQTGKITHGNGKQIDLLKDPLLKIIGKISVKPFADSIDRELYG